MVMQRNNIGATGAQGKARALASVSRLRIPQRLDRVGAGGYEGLACVVMKTIEQSGDGAYNQKSNLNVLCQRPSHPSKPRCD